MVLLVGLAVANLRGVRESGRLFAPPTYGYIAIMIVFIGYGLIRTRVRRPRAAAGRPGGARRDHRQRRAAGRRVAVPADAGLLVGRHRAVGRRGHLQRRAGLPPARGPQRRHRAHVDRHDPGRAVLRRRRAGPAAAARRSARTRRSCRPWAGPCSATTTRSTTCCSSSPRRSSILSANTAFADFPRLSAVIAARRLPAPPARQPRRPAGVLQRHHRPGRGVGRAARGLRRRRVVAGAPVRGRACSPASRSARPAWSCTTAGCASRAGGWAWPSTRSAPLATAVVLVVILVSKFTEGAWVPTLVIPADHRGRSSPIHRHYARWRQSLALRPAGPGARSCATPWWCWSPARPGRPRTPSATPRRCGPTTSSPSPSCTTRSSAPSVETAWDDAGLDVPLEIIEDEYRDLSEPIEEFLDRHRRPVGRRHAHRGDPRVRRPRLVGAPAPQPERPRRSRPACSTGRDTVVTSVPWHID